MRIKIDNVRCDWPELFVGKQFKGTGKFRCGAQLLVPEDHLKFNEINAAIDQAAIEKWKDKAKANVKSARTNNNVSFREGDDNVFTLSANCRGGDTEAESTKPLVVTAAGKKATAQDNLIRRGSFVNAIVEIYADDRYGAGVFAQLVGIQYRADGGAFGGQGASVGDFDDMSGDDEVFA